MSILCYPCNGRSFHEESSISETIPDREVLIKTPAPQAHDRLSLSHRFLCEGGRERAGGRGEASSDDSLSATFETMTACAVDNGWFEVRTVRGLALSAEGTESARERRGGRD